jgi:hypothetical protein
MKKIATLILVFSLAGLFMCAQKKTGADRGAILVNKYFVNDITYVIICRGYPREGLEGLQAVETAKEAALLNAQIIARETFNDSIDVVKGGSVEGYEINEREAYAQIRYVIKAPGLKKNLRTVKQYGEE